MKIFRLSLTDGRKLNVHADHYVKGRRKVEFFCDSSVDLPFVSYRKADLVMIEEAWDEEAHFETSVAV